MVGRIAYDDEFFPFFSIAWEIRIFLKFFFYHFVNLKRGIGFLGKWIDRLWSMIFIFANLEKIRIFTVFHSSWLSFHPWKLKKKEYVFLGNWIDCLWSNDEFYRFFTDFLIINILWIKFKIHWNFIYNFIIECCQQQPLFHSCYSIHTLQMFCKQRRNSHSDKFTFYLFSLHSNFFFSFPRVDFFL